MKDIFPFYSIGHFINEPTNPTAFEVLQFEKMSEPDVADVHKHTFYEIIWTESGNSTQTIDYKEYAVAPQSLFFISPNQVHQFEAWRPLKGGSILFTEDFFLLNRNDTDRLFELSCLDNFYGNPCIHLNKKEFVDVKSTIDFIVRENARRDRNLRILQSLLHVLLEQAQRLADRATKTPVSKKYLVLYKRFKKFVEAHFAENQTAAFYAEKLFITPHHLNLVCKAVTGKTASGVLRARSILEAKRFLTFSEMTVSEIAARLNYFDSSYFAKLFKAETGQSPLAFREEMSEKYRTKSTQS
jgi:AraC-like DNA-binding protein